MVSSGTSTRIGIFRFPTDSSQTNPHAIYRIIVGYNVRRAKALAPSGCEARPANCRSSRKPSERVMEVTTWTEALRREGPPFGGLSEHAGRNASERYMRYRAYNV